MASDTDPDQTRFDQLQLGTALQRVLPELGYETPSPIQAQSIPVLLQGQNLLGQAQTGTGKTAAFALPALEKINLDKRAPQVLVLTPTRELALQVSEAFSSYARYLPDLSVLTVYGGQAMHLQLRALKRGPHVVVGTPGRIMDHLRRKTLPLEHIDLVVLDEADEMLKMGFIEDVETILSHTPEDRQTALFSATMPASIRKIAHRYMPEACEIKIAAKTATVDAVKQSYWLTKAAEKKAGVVRLLDTEAYDAMLIFVRTRSDTLMLADYLTEQGYGAGALNGDMTQASREAMVSKLKRGKIDILVATDVAARGLDVERISHVLNYDISYDAETYVHRIGRTARAGRGGNAITFITSRERQLMRVIEKSIKCQIAELKMATADVVADKRIAEFKKKLANTISHDDMAYYREILEAFCAENDISATDAAAALLYMAQKERPFKVRELDTKPARSDYRVKSEHRSKSERRSKPEYRARSEHGSKSEYRARSEHGSKPEYRAKSEYRAKPAPFDKKSVEGQFAEGQFNAQRKTAKQARPKHESRQHENNSDVPLLSYRLEIGRDHNVRAGDIVGAIANEVGLNSSHIGRIQLFDDHSTVDLPEMPRALLKHLRKTWIRNRQLRISLSDQKKDLHKSMYRAA